MNSLTFRGIRKNWLYLERGRAKPPFSAINRNTFTIPGRPGAFLRNSQRAPMVIEQPVGFKVTNNNDIQALRYKDELAEWLVTDEPAALQFDDEPGRTYYAVVQNTIEDFERMATLRSGTIQFLVLDGVSYSDMIHHNLSTSSFIANEGTAETYPSFEVNVERDITELTIANNSIEGSPTVVLGRPLSVDQEPYQREELVFHDSMRSLSGWQQASVVDVGHIAGDMTLDEDGFYAENYGEDITEHNWQGPSLQRGIGTSLTDFRADVRIESRAYEAGTGMLDVYFRDANGNLITKIGFGDYHADNDINYGRAQLGNFGTDYQENIHHKYPGNWREFDGFMRVERVNNTFSFTFGQIGVTGRTNSRIKVTHVDNDNNFTAPITTVQVGFRKNTLNPGRMRLRVKDIKVYKINKRENTSVYVPYIAQAGDVLTIDNKASTVMKNGEYANDIISLESEFFPLVKGYNDLKVTPSDAAEVYAMYQRAYL